MHAQTSGWISIKLCMQGPYHPGQFIETSCQKEAKLFHIISFYLAANIVTLK